MHITQQYVTLERFWHKVCWNKDTQTLNHLHVLFFLFYEWRWAPLFSLQFVLLQPRRPSDLQMTGLWRTKSVCVHVYKLLAGLRAVAELKQLILQSTESILDVPNDKKLIENMDGRNTLTMSTLNKLPFSPLLSVLSSLPARLPAECSRPCCAWLGFQGPGSQSHASPVGKALWSGMAGSCWPCLWTAAGSEFAALPGHVWNGPAVMYCAASHLIYAYLWRASL